MRDKYKQLLTRLKTKTHITHMLTFSPESVKL